MKYDEMILDCHGDCNSCEVMLECQYQTSDGEEKQKYLKLLEERDRAAEGLNETCANDYKGEPCEEVQAETDTNSENVEDTEDIAEGTAETVEDTEATVAISDEEIKEIYDSVFGLKNIEAEGDSEETENNNEIVTETMTENQEEKAEECSCKELAVIAASKEVVDGIFAEVFGLNEVTEHETEVLAEAETEHETVAETNEPVEETADVTETVDNSVEAIEEAPAETETTVELSCKEEVIVPAEKEVVDSIFVEVFGLKKVSETATKEAIEEVSETVTEETVEVAPAAEATTEEVTETAETNTTESPAETSEPQSEATEATAETTETTPGSEDSEGSEEEPAQKATFKLVPPENNEELMAQMCTKRARKLIYRPSETLISSTFKVLGTDKKNEVGEKIKDVIDAEIKQGVKVGYLDKFDGLSSSEIKEEYENDVVYEYADQEFKKTGVIYDGKKIRVYIYDWDGKACHHVGFIDEAEAKNFIPYFIDKESYSFDVCGIITGGKGKRVTKVGDTLKIIKEKGDPIGIDVDIAIIKRKD